MSADPSLLPLLRELETVSADLASLHREEAVAFLAYRRKYLQTYTHLMSEQQKSATEARVWADADAHLLQSTHVTLRADIAALTERRDYLRTAVSVASVAQSGSS